MFHLTQTAKDVSNFRAKLGRPDKIILQFNVSTEVYNMYIM